MRGGGSYDRVVGCRLGRWFAWAYFALALWSSHCDLRCAAGCKLFGFPDLSGVGPAKGEGGAQAKRRVRARLESLTQRELSMTILDPLTGRLIKKPNFAEEATSWVK